MTLEFLSSSPAVSRETADALGGARLGLPLPVVDWPEQGIFAPLLGATAASRRELWTAAGPLSGGDSEGIAWRRRGELLYGVIELAEADFAAAAGESPLQAASRAAYERIFRLLDAQGLPYLWRVWNYLAEINGESHGLERYRQFNAGRQEAFLACRGSAVGNVPAACALGLAGGPLSIAFLAGPTPAVPIENPRQVSAYDYPADYGPRSPTFSRAALVYPAGRECLFVSGTASIVGHRSVHIDDVVGQSREALANVAAVVAEANRLSRGAPYALGALAYRVYVRDAADFALIAATLTPLLEGAADVVYVQADICRADLLLEIEAQASQTLEPT